MSLSQTPLAARHERESRRDGVCTLILATPFSSRSSTGTTWRANSGHDRACDGGFEFGRNSRLVIGTLSSDTDRTMPAAARPEWENRGIGSPSVAMPSYRAWPRGLQKNVVGLDTTDLGAGMACRQRRDKTVVPWLVP